MGSALMQGPYDGQDSSMAQQQLDPSSKYDVRQQIGKGSFGSAFLVTNKHDRKDYVLKRVRLAKQTKWQRNFTLQERDLVTTLKHPFIVPCVETWIVQGHTVNMVYGYCEKGDVAAYLQKVQKLRSQVDEGQMLKWLCQLLLALDYLQTKKILHRDIKTSNLLLTSDMDVQIGDFGLATRMQNMGAASKPQDTNLVGTPHYMSPELLSCKEYGFKTDVWSLGCVFYELTAQRPTFNAFNIHGLVSKIKKNKLAPLPDSYSKNWRDVIELMLLKNPDKRPSVQQLMALPCLRPAILQARQRAQQLMPDVQLPPLLEPTPFEVRQSISAGQEQDDDCESPAVELAARFTDALDAITAVEPEQQVQTGWGGAASAVPPVGECEMLQLWSSNSLQKDGDLQPDELADKVAICSVRCQAAHIPHDQVQYGMQIDALDTQPADTISSRCSNDSYAGSSTPGSLKQRPKVKVDSTALHSTGRQAVSQPGIKQTRAERVAAAIAAARRKSPGAATAADQAAVAATQPAQRTPSSEGPGNCQDGHSSRDSNHGRKDSNSTQAVFARQQAAASLSARLASYKESKRAAAAAAEGRSTSKPTSARGIPRSSPRPAWNAGAGVNAQNPAPAALARQRSNGGRSAGGANALKAAAAAVASAAANRAAAEHGNGISSKHGLPKRSPSAGSPYLQALQDHNHHRRQHSNSSNEQQLSAADSVHHLLSASQQLTMKVGQLQQGLQQQQQQQQSSHAVELRSGKQELQQSASADITASETESDTCASAIKRLHFGSLSPSLSDNATSMPRAETPDIHAAALGAEDAGQPQHDCSASTEATAAQNTPVFWATAAASSHPSDSGASEHCLQVQSVRSASLSRPTSAVGNIEPSTSAGTRQLSPKTQAAKQKQSDPSDTGSVSHIGQLCSTERQRLEFLETSVLLVGSLYARRRWQELGSILESPGVLPYDISSAVQHAKLQEPAFGARSPCSSTGNGHESKDESPQRCCEGRQQQREQMLKLGDTVMLGRKQQIKGRIRYIGPVAWDQTGEDWVGMELDTPCGVDAIQEGIKYFDCPARSATFHRATQLTAYRQRE